MSSPKCLWIRKRRYILEVRRSISFRLDNPATDLLLSSIRKLVLQTGSALVDRRPRQRTAPAVGEGVGILGVGRASDGDAGPGVPAPEPRFGRRGKRCALQKCLTVDLLFVLFGNNASPKTGDGATGLEPNNIFARLG